MSSLHQRFGEWGSDAQVAIATQRLDSFFRYRAPASARLALWLDTEGMAYEAVEGLSGVAERVQLLHIEVESEACIGTRQRLYPEVRQLLARFGFIELATDLPRQHVQFNALFVRRAVPAAEWLEIRAALLLARLRHLRERAYRSCGARLRAVRSPWGGLPR